MSLLAALRTVTPRDLETSDMNWALSLSCSEQIAHSCCSAVAFREKVTGGPGVDTLSYFSKEDDGAEEKGPLAMEVGDDTGLATNTAFPTFAQSTASALASFLHEVAQEHLRELKRNSSWKAGEIDASCIAG